MEMERHKRDRSIKGGGSAETSSRLPVAYELELHRVIELEAFLNAEKDGFKCSPQDYWLAAERDVHQYY
jgi:hypothetical protein